MKTLGIFLFLLSLSVPRLAHAEPLDVTGSYVFTYGGQEVGYIQPYVNGQIRGIFRDIFNATLDPQNRYVYGEDPVFRKPSADYSGPVGNDQIQFGNRVGLVTLIPNRPLEGNWLTASGASYLSCRITRSFNTLTFYNENGGSAYGRVESNGSLRAERWNLDGQANNDVTIRWANGSVWEKVPDVGGTYFEGSQKVIQNGLNLTFINEQGGSSAGIVLSPTRVQATGWGNLVGTLAKDGNGRVLRIEWANGSKWDRLPSQLAGKYYFLGGSGLRVTGPSIEINGHSLTICNENHGCSTGDFISANVIRAIDWGLRGTLITDPGNGAITDIQWSNNSAWKKVIFRP